MLSKISIEDIQKEIKAKDKRTARKWCTENGVLLVIQCNEEYAPLSGFEEAFERPLIEKLKKRYGDSWKQVYELYREENIVALHLIQTADTTLPKYYQAESEIEKKYHDEIWKTIENKTAKK